MLLETEIAVKRLVKTLSKTSHFIIDTETTGVGQEQIKLSNDALILDRARLLLVSICDEGVSYSIPTSLLNAKYLPPTKVVELLKPLLVNPKICKVGHNMNYDVNVFCNYGVRMKNIYCTMIAGACVDENLPKGLKERAVLVNSLIRPTKTVDFSNPAELAEYAEQDAVVTWKLFNLYEYGEPTKEYLLTKKNRVHFEREMAVLEAIISMERRGARINKNKLLLLDVKIKKKLNSLLKEIYLAAGKPFNVRSNDQLAEVLFDKLKLPVVKTTNSGKRSVDKEVLFTLQGKHKIVDALVEYAKLEKLSNTYTDKDSGLLAYADSNGRIHCSFNTIGAVTFRMSCSRPNLQTIPSKTDSIGIRKCFIPADGCDLIVADMNQVELRILALFSKDKRMLKVYNDPDGDIHQMTADECGVSRAVAKSLNFGLMYGMGAYTLAKALTMQSIPTSEHEAKAYIDSYFKTYSGVKPFQTRLFESHRKHGFIRYITGRKRRVPNMDSASYSLKSAAERECSNNIIQGSASDWLKAAMIRIDRDPMLKACKCRMLLQVHDELVFECPKRSSKIAAKRIKRLMEKSPRGMILDLSCPITANVAVGANWADAKK